MEWFHVTIYYYFKRGGRDIPIFKLTRLVGTILAKEDKKSLIVLLTPEGDVINVKFSKKTFEPYIKSEPKSNRQHVILLISLDLFILGFIV